MLKPLTPQYQFVQSFTSSFRSSRTKDSKTLLSRSVQDMFLMSPRFSGPLFFGIIITNSFFQQEGQTYEYKISYISVKGMASKSESLTEGNVPWYHGYGLPHLFQPGGNFGTGQSSVSHRLFAGDIARQQWIKFHRDLDKIISQCLRDLLVSFSWQ